MSSDGDNSECSCCTSDSSTSDSYENDSTSESCESDSNTSESYESDSECNCCYKYINFNKVYNILVIGQVIHDSDITKDLRTLQLKVPKKYFEYDGTLTTDAFSSVRWIIDDDILKLNIKDIVRVSKTSRQIQNNDGRIILFKN